jgi:hypothetical protein
MQHALQRRGIHASVCLEDIQGRGIFDGQGLEGSIILKWILKKLEVLWCRLDSSSSIKQTSIPKKVGKPLNNLTGI